MTSPRIDDRFSDGHQPTSSIRPCTCPTCHEALEVACPNRCANAVDGTMVEVPRALSPRAPRTPWIPPEKKSRYGKRHAGGTRDKVLAALAAGPLQVSELAVRLDDPVGVVDAMCRILWKEGAVVRIYPPGKTRPMSLALSTADAR